MKMAGFSRVAVTAGLALAQAQMAAAQSAAKTDDVKTISTLKVEDAPEPAPQATAAKSDVALIETPQAISVITAETIQDRNFQRLGEVLEGVAGLRCVRVERDARRDEETHDAWDLRLTVNNLLDERYFPDGSFHSRITPGEPRNWVLSATYRY
jgi:outer membrane receptor for ferric coprogen and ferric-rhodotorulic acid